MHQLSLCVWDNKHVPNKYECLKKRSSCHGVVYWVAFGLEVGWWWYIGDCSAHAPTKDKEKQICKKGTYCKKDGEKGEWEWNRMRRPDNFSCKKRRGKEDKVFAFFAAALLLMWSSSSKHPNPFQSYAFMCLLKVCGFLHICRKGPFRFLLMAWTEKGQHSVQCWNV